MSDERPPNSSPGPPTALQQLEASLAAGHLTPELFATLSAQLPAAAPVAPAAPPAPPAPKERTFSPRGTDEELPSLLDMFNQPPVAPVSLPPVAPPAPPVARPAPASPAQSSAADAAARRIIEERLAQIRQQPAPPLPTPAATPVARPTPTFYPEPPAPTFYPTTPVVEVASPPPAQPAPPRAAPPRPPAAPAKPASGRTGGLLLLLLLGLALAGGLAYFFIQNSHPDEALTSPSLPTADAAPKETTAPKPARQPKKSAKKKRKKKVAAPVITASESEAVPEEESTAENPSAAAVTTPPAREVPATTQRSPPAAPEPGDDAATIKIRTVMAAYYADLFTPPLHASQYFAPQVERLYIQQNLTPAAIDAELARSFFPENQQAIARIEPGTLRVSAPAADGSRTATFTETMRLYRVSLQKKQQLRTQVRVRFNADNKIVYMRQEKLLANTFE